MTASDLNAVAGAWDDIVAGVRRERPFIATLLEQALPISTTGSGVLVLQVDAPAVQEGLDRKVHRDGRSRWVAGSRACRNSRCDWLVMRSPPPRLTDEMVRSERIAALRRKDPVLDAAIDALDLDLAD